MKVVSLGAKRASHDPWRLGGPPTIEYVANGTDDVCGIPNCLAFAVLQVGKRNGCVYVCLLGEHIQRAMMRFLPLADAPRPRSRVSWIEQGPPALSRYDRRKWRKAYHAGRYGSGGGA